MRKSRESKTVDADLTKPIDKSSIVADKDSCFGNEWSMSSIECPQCADRDICGILFKDLVDAKAIQIEKDSGTKFLDVADFPALTESCVEVWVESGVTTSVDLLKFGMERANCDDIIAVRDHLKRMIKDSSSLSIKDGKVWIK